MARFALKKIENRRNRQVTFTKRRKGLFKKAYELSILCDIDIALITYSPSGRPFLFSGKKRIEDVIERYINHPHDDASSSKYNSPCSDSSDAKELKREIGTMQHLLEDAKEQLRSYDVGPLEKASTVDMDSCERDLLDILTRVMRRKEYLLNNFLSSSDISTINIPTSSGNEVMSQFPDYARAIDASAASNPLLDILQTEFDPSKMYYVPPDMPQESILFTFQSCQNMEIQNEQLPQLAMNDEGEIYEGMSSNQ